MIFYLLNISIETLSHIAGIMGLISIIITVMLTWRKHLLTSGFENFQDIYRIEMTEFKTTVREYSGKNDDRHTRTLDRVAELYEKIQIQNQEIHDQIIEQNKICDIVQSSKRIISKQETTWKKKIEFDLVELTKKIDHINEMIYKRK